MVGTSWDGTNQPRSWQLGALWWVSSICLPMCSIARVMSQGSGLHVSLGSLSPLPAYPRSYSTHQVN